MLTCMTKIPVPTMGQLARGFSELHYLQWLAQCRAHKNTEVPGSVLWMPPQLAGTKDGEADWTLCSYCSLVPKRSTLERAQAADTWRLSILPGPSGLGLCGGHWCLCHRMAICLYTERSTSGGAQRSPEQNRPRAGRGAATGAGGGPVMLGSY